MIIESQIDKLVPMQMLSGVEAVGYQSEGWNLDQWDESTCCEPRHYEIDIHFEESFGGSPLVHVALTGFDVDKDISARLEVKAVDITDLGFKLVLTTWLRTKLYQVNVNWLALGSSKV